MAKPTVASLSEDVRVMRDNYQERLAELELELEDRGWDKLSGGSDTEFTRPALRKICKESLLFYLKNPLIGRAAKTQANYVFGNGVTIKANHPVVDEVVQAFLADRKNRKALTNILSMVKADKDLAIDANLFPVFFSNKDGDTRLSMVPFSEIQDIKTNPDDRYEAWYYERQWSQTRDTLGRFNTIRKEYYPDWCYHPDDELDMIDGKPVNWDKPMMHVKVNAALDQKFGTSELYAAQDWARAYNRFLTDWATIVRSYAKFAWAMVKKTGSAGRIAAKAKLDSNLSSDQYKPAPAAGSVFISDADTKMTPMRTAGATTSAEDGRRLLLMVCAATGLPETFYGDASVGTLATARSLNRPTELSFSLRQLLWESIWEDICEFVIQTKADVGYRSDDPAIKGNLTGEWEEDAWEEQHFVYADDTENEDADLKGKPIDTSVSIDFPSLVEDDQKAQVDAIVSAATLNGSPLAGTIDAEYTTERLLRVLGETSIEEVMKKLFPEGEEPEAKAVAGAVNDLQQAIEALSETRGVDREEIVKELVETFKEAFKVASKEAGDEA